MRVFLALFSHKAIIWDMSWNIPSNLQILANLACRVTFHRKAQSLILIIFGHDQVHGHEGIKFYRNVPAVQSLRYRFQLCGVEI